MLKWVALSAAAVLGFASLAQATPRVLADNNGVSSGWTWDVSSALEPLVNLVFIRTEGNNFFVEKDAEIRNVTDPIVITFNKVDANAKTLVINDEAVVNNSGVDWSSFRFELSSGSTGGTPNFAFATSNGAAGIGDFKIDPFQQFAFANNNTQLTFSGGSPIKAGTTWFPGSQSTTGISIIANGNDNSFTLKELANPGATPPPSVIPLPAAAWTGLSGLLGLAVIGGVKRVRRHLA